MRIVPLLLLVLTFSSISAQNFNFQSLALEKELTKNADAIYRLDELLVTIEARDLMRVNLRQVVTVLNEKGNRSVRTHLLYERDDRINDMEVIVYDDLGREVKKYKKKDFNDSSAVPGGTLYSDSRIKHLHYVPVSYPYTLEFSYEFVTRNTAFIPRWYFLGSYRTSVEKSRYQVDFKPGLTYKYKEYNFEGYDIQKEKTTNGLRYEAGNLHAIKSEALAPPLSEFTPRVKVALDEFHLEGYNGSAVSWESLGKWVYDELLVGRDELDPETISKVQSLVSGVEDPMEKIDIVYKYVQSNTRYISVQLGIGGWMPISAAEVDRVKYGDCKGLTNYTKALLNSIGIDSYYTVIYAGKEIKDLEEDFVSIQGNHAILNIPLEEGDAWLECTSQIKPTNFHGSFTDNRKVMRVTPEGGEIIRTPAFPLEGNTLLTKADCYLDTNGDMKGVFVITSQGAQYDKRFRIERMQQDEIEKFYKKEWSYVDNIVLKDPVFNNDRQNVVFKENISAEIPSYGSLFGDQILFTPNVISRRNTIPKRYRTRTLGFRIDRGFSDQVEYLIQPPEGYVMEAPMEDQIIENQFGSYQLSIKLSEEGKILYKRSLTVKEGKYSKDDYNNYRDFRKQIAKLENSKIILTKI